MQDKNQERFSLWDKITINKGISFDLPQSQWEEAQKDKTILIDKFDFYYIGTINEVRLRLSKKYLSIIGAQKDKVKMVLKLQYAKCFWTIANGKPGISFFHSRSEYQFSSTIKILQNWREELRKHVLVSDVRANYSPISKIGIGSFSKVYLVKHKETGIQYAAKQFSKKSTLKNRLEIQLLWNEINMMKTLGQNDYTIQLFEVYESKNSIYLILEYLPGSTLRKTLKSQFYEDEEIKIILQKILECIAYCNEKGIMHRDVKPENIIFKVDEQLNSLKLINFGLSRFIGEKEVLKPNCGTPGYIAPEVFEEENYSKKCDVFSIGSIFYSLATSAPLFSFDKGTPIFKQNELCQINYDFPKIKSIQCFDLLRKMLKEDPSKRISIAECLQHRFLMTDMKELQLKKFSFQSTVFQPTRSLEMAIVVNLIETVTTSMEEIAANEKLAFELSEIKWGKYNIMGGYICKLGPEECSALQI